MSNEIQSPRGIFTERGINRREALALGATALIGGLVLNRIISSQEFKYWPEMQSKGDDNFTMKYVDHVWGQVRNRNELVHIPGDYTHKIFVESFNDQRDIDHKLESVLQDWKEGNKDKGDSGGKNFKIIGDDYGAYHVPSVILAKNGTPYFSVDTYIFKANDRTWFITRSHQLDDPELGTRREEAEKMLSTFKAR